jgi:hypothetical protein
MSSSVKQYCTGRPSSQSHMISSSRVANADSLIMIVYTCAGDVGSDKRSRQLIIRQQVWFACTQIIV